MIVPGYAGAALVATGLIMWIVQRVNSHRAKQRRREETAAAEKPPSDNAGLDPRNFGRG